MAFGVSIQKKSETAPSDPTSRTLYYKPMDRETKITLSTCVQADRRSIYYYLSFFHFNMHDLEILIKRDSMYDSA